MTGPGREGAASLSAALTTAVVAAAIWAVVDVLRVGARAPALAGFGALLGSASLVLGACVVSLRRARAGDARLRATLGGCALAALPLAVLGAIVQRTTHHRALGGVTFAVVAAVVLLVAVAFSWRLSGVARSGGGGATLARGVLLVAPLASLLGTALLALRGLAATTLGPAVVDAVLGALSLAAAWAAVPLAARLPPKLGPSVWIVVLVVGVATIASQPSLCPALTERAPVAFALGAGCGG